MGVLLGDEWVRPGSDPLDVPGFAEQDLVAAQQADAVHKALLESLLRQIAANVAVPVPEPQASVVSVSSPMTVDTTGLVSAFAQALAGLPRAPDLTAELAGLAKTLDKLDRRVGAGALSGPVAGGGANGHVTVDGPVTANVAGVALDVTLQDVKRHLTDYRTLLDYDTRTDSLPVYVGKNLQVAAATASSWVIQKLLYDASSRLVDTQVLTGKWSDRASLSWT